MLLVGRESSKIYASAKFFIRHYDRTPGQNLQEMTVDKFYELTLHPEYEHFWDLDIYIVPNIDKSMHYDFDISYSYIAILDNISRNREVFEKSKIFIIGLPDQNSDDDIVSTYYQAFWSRFKEPPEPHDGFGLLYRFEPMEDTLKVQEKDPGILFSH